jgi:hypothetical protein
MDASSNGQQHHHTGTTAPSGACTSTSSAISRLPTRTALSEKTRSGRGEPPSRPEFDIRGIQLAPNKFGSRDNVARKPVLAAIVAATLGIFETGAPATDEGPILEKKIVLG